MEPMSGSEALEHLKGSWMYIWRLFLKEDLINQDVCVILKKKSYSSEYLYISIEKLSNCSVCSLPTSQSFILISTCLCLENYT